MPPARRSWLGSGATHTGWDQHQGDVSYLLLLLLCFSATSEKASGLCQKQSQCQEGHKGCFPPLRGAIQDPSPLP